MQNKTIDGMVGAAAPYVAFKYYDIAKPMTFLPATMFAAPVVVNRHFMKSLGPELEKIVREESRKAEVLFGDWNIADIKSQGRDLAARTAARSSPCRRRNRSATSTWLRRSRLRILSANPKVKDDYEALLAAAKKYRQIRLPVQSCGCAGASATVGGGPAADDRS